VNHIGNAFFVLFNALIGIGDSNRLFDNAVGEIRKLNFDIELIKGLFCCWIALIGIIKRMLNAEGNFIFFFDASIMENSLCSD